MRTTLIIVELVIIGIQTLTWVLLLAFTLIKYDITKDPMFIQNWAPLLSILVIGTAYTTGLIWEVLFRGIRNSDLGLTLKSKKDDLDYEEIRIRITMKYPELNSNLDKLQNQIRLIGGSIINDVLTAICGIAYVIVVLSISKHLIFIIGILSVGLIFVAYIAWVMATNDYRNQLRKSKILIDKESN